MNPSIHNAEVNKAHFVRHVSHRKCKYMINKEFSPQATDSRVSSGQGSNPGILLNLFWYRLEILNYIKKIHNII